jgi:hypothetical protein
MAALTRASGRIDVFVVDDRHTGVQHLTRTIVETYLDHGDPLPPSLAALDLAGPIDLKIPVGIR